MLPTSKFGNCSRCPTKNTNVRKRGKDLVCIPCCQIEDNAKQIEKQKEKQKVQRLLSSVKSSPENKLLVQNKTELDRWFAYVATVIKSNPHCWGCGEFIPEQYYRHASAHIFPKALFPSIATHPLNFLVLSAGCGCHSEFDSSIEKAANMRVWGMAVDRFKKFESQITETHKYLDLFKSKIPC